MSKRIHPQLEKTNTRQATGTGKNWQTRRSHTEKKTL